jgi:ribosomal protein L7/L12
MRVHVNADEHTVHSGAAQVHSNFGELPMAKFQVNVKIPSEDRTAFVKALRTVGRISLKRAAELAVYLERHRNSTLVAGVDQQAAEHIAKTLTASGAIASVAKSGMDTPVMCCPQAAQMFKWGRLRTLAKVG